MINLSYLTHINGWTSINEKSVVEICGEEFQFAAKKTTWFCQHLILSMHLFPLSRNSCLKEKLFMRNFSEINIVICNFLKKYCCVNLFPWISDLFFCNNMLCVDVVTIIFIFFMFICSSYCSVIFLLYNGDSFASMCVCGDNVNG
jgi:hypothetical protein